MNREPFDREIASLKYAIIDLDQFLQIHPGDIKAQELRESYAGKLRELSIASGQEITILPLYAEEENA